MSESHEFLHELLEMESPVSSLCAAFFIIDCNVVGDSSGCIDCERNGFSYMYAPFGGVSHDLAGGLCGPRFIPVCKFIHYRTNDAVVEIFDGPYFKVDVPIVSGFIGRFYVEKYKIIRA